MKNKTIILITIFTLIFANIYVSFGDEILPYGQDDPSVILSDSEESQDVNILILYDKSSKKTSGIYTTTIINPY